MNSSARWLVLFIFTLASSLSYLDRQILAALAPAIKTDFALNDAQYGLLISAFSIFYAVGSPLAGYTIDRIGLNLGISLSVGLWSLAGIATGLTSTFTGLLGCRAWLGATESGAIPASGKAAALYLKPQERAIGAGFGQIGITIGMVGAPVMATALAAAYGWRSAFVVSGLLGFVWIPLWLATARAYPPAFAPPPQQERPKVGPMLRDKRFYGLIAANIFSLTAYSLWSNWITIFFVDTYRLTQNEANLRYVWIPPFFAALGGLVGGSLSYRFANRGQPLYLARIRAAGLSALMLLGTSFAPMMPSPALATAAVCWSFFWTVAMSVNVYSLPLDYFGAERAAFGVSALTGAYGLLQTGLSPLIGYFVMHYGFVPVCAGIAATPIVSYLILKGTARAE